MKIKKFKNYEEYVSLQKDKTGMRKKERSGLAIEKKMLNFSRGHSNLI